MNFYKLKDNSEKMKHYEKINPVMNLNCVF